MRGTLRDTDARTRREFEACVMRIAVGNLLVLFGSAAGMIPGFRCDSVVIWAIGGLAGGAVGFALSFAVDPWSTRVGYALSDWAERVAANRSKR